ncbi:MAG: site-specific DNA-methyltransferase [Janthinobacterium lividum]
MKKMTCQTELNLCITKIAKQFGLENVDLASKPRHTLSKRATTVQCSLYKGENLDVLDSMLETCSSTIDFVYIDPPYNTGQKFIYLDKRSGLSKGIWGRHHDWMAFMLPRLVAMKFLLVDSGIIAISIDDYEYAHLKIVLDAVFGPDSYLGTLVVCRSVNGKGSKLNIAVNHEYVLLFGKSSKATLFGLPETEEKIYDREDEFGKYRIDGLFRKKGDASLKEDRPNMHYPLYYADDGKVFTEKGDNLKVTFPLDSKGVERRWLWGPDKAKVDSWKLHASEKGVVYVKNYQSVNKKTKLRSILSNPGYLTDRATVELKDIFGDKVFETPKPVKLIRDLVDCCAPPNATVLDFFAGSGTTAQAVQELNVRDGTSRKTILIEHNFEIPNDHIAKKNGFHYTSDLTEARLSFIQRLNPEFNFESVPID